MTSEHPFNERDIQEIARHGLSLEDAEHQMHQLRNRPPFARLARACTPGDGILEVSDEARARYVEAADAAAHAGRITKLVPASGAATRMFQSLLAVAGERPSPSPSELAERAAGGESGASDAIELLEEIERFPFAGALGRAMSERGLDLIEACRRGDVNVVLDALLSPGGLGYASLPKGQLPFHGYAGEVRTPLEEHLVEAAAHVRDADGTCRLHVTVSPEHRAGFEQLVSERAHVLEKRLGVRFEITFSSQHGSTDTLAAELDGRPFRESDGSLLFRPGGHGALIENLSDLGGDIVLLKNIDNVVPDRTKPLLVTWKKIVTGVLVTLEARVHDILRRLERGEDIIEEAISLLETEFSRPDERPRHGASPAGARAFLTDRLERPLRVAGVVRNQGEPGGGPFWVHGPNGRCSIQIVETSQIDADDADQRTIAASATHFNPVDIACALRGPRGEPHRLARFVDPETVFISRRSKDGRELLALERPGLWNGAMAGWNTVLVEVPIETFAPVKTVFDLLRPDHRTDE